ncbi:succinate dehydrogenase/fumarate reductase iron-sulfur subunit [Slackia heliotrinireducens]|uniref:succinate dehydrogenase/fumarate reductase iron-sulfur subunit n=1 Tax=Slackia heliotrinireducens TaxID=84110 RepID=UPI0033151A0A
METITFIVNRFDGQKSWKQEYRFERSVMTLLGCLNKIREEQDDSLCFTQACRHSICGSCAIQVNGSAYLACETQLDDLIDTFKTTRFELAPLNNFPVVRDLVVSFDEKAEKMKKVMPWMCEHKNREGHEQTEADYHKYMEATDCVLCGCCASECRELVYDDGTYLEPFIMNKAFRFIRDSRDECGDERILAVLDNNLWKCIHCQQCTTKCPKEIPIAEEISYMRRRALRMGEDKSQGARHAYAFHHDVLKTGMLNETMLALKTEGLYKTAQNRVPFAVRMVTSGKMNPLHIQKPVKGIEGVRKLYEIAKKSEQED